MNFTQANGYVTHAETGYRMAQDTGIVPTEIAAQDANMVVWSLMQFVLKAGRTPVAFNADSPDSYTVLFKAMVDLFYPVGGEQVMHLPASEWNPNTLFPWTTWVQAPARTVPGQLDGDDTVPGGWGELGNVVGALSVAMSSGNLPSHAHNFLPGAPEVLLRRSDGSGTVAGVYTGSDLALAPATATQAAGSDTPTPVPVVQPTQITIRWIRTA